MDVALRIAERVVVMADGLVIADGHARRDPPRPARQRGLPRDGRQPCLTPARADAAAASTTPLLEVTTCAPATARRRCSSTCRSRWASSRWRSSGATAWASRRCATRSSACCRRRPARVSLGGTTLSGRHPERIAQAGIAYVPQGRRLFATLTVDEHIAMLAKGARGKRWTPDAVFELFPRLAQRRRSRAGDLSGGEQQMLAVGRALLLNGSLVMMDEPSEGLAPTIVDTLIEVGAPPRRRGRRRARRRAEPLRRHAHGRARARDGGRSHRGRDDGHRPCSTTPSCNAATSASKRSRRRSHDATRSTSP